MAEGHGMTRYTRQEAVIGSEGQARLGAARVLVVGAGGLGVPVLQYLAGAGVGQITILDPDRVEVSNLHRQPLYRIADCGVPKAEAAREALLALNPELRITACVQAIDPDNAAQIVAAHDLALDCADSFAVSYILSDTCLALGLPLISASALERSGYAGGFCRGAPSLRAVFPDLPERAATCAAAGVMGPVVGAIGAMQAQMALAVLLDMAPSPLGQMVTWDAAGWRMGGFRFDGAPEPDRPLRFISPATIQAGDLTIDLRDPEEGPLATPWALRISPERLGAEPPAAAPGQRVVLCCRSGLRAWRAARQYETSSPAEVVLVALGQHPPG